MDKLARRAGTGACGATAPQDDLCPLISVVIPAYNAQGWVADCIGSVAAQTYSNWECILVDDGSTDNTRAVAEGMKPACGGRLTVLSKPNGGAASARNAGLAAAKGEYVVFADADDLLTPQELEYAWRAQRENPTGFVVWNAGTGGREPVYRTEVMTRAEAMVAFEFRGNMVVPYNKMFQRRVLAAMPMWFDEVRFVSRSVGEDKDFVDRYLAQHWEQPGACCVYLDAELYIGRSVNPNSLCAAYQRTHENMTDARREDPPVAGYLPKKLAEIEQATSQGGKFAADPNFRRELACHYLVTLSYGVYSARRLGEPLPAGFWTCEPLRLLLDVCREQKRDPLYYLLFRLRAAALIDRVYVAKCRRAPLYYRLDKLARLLLPGWR